MSTLTQTSAVPAARQGGVAVAATVILLLFVFSAAGSALRKPVTQGFDEVAHVSYVAYLQTTHQAWPRLEQMRLIDPDTFKFTERANYLNHPPFYYRLIAALGPEVSEQPASLIHLRLLNVAVGALGLLALLGLAARMKLEGLEFYAFAVSCAAVPVLAPLAGSVNNDNLCFAGGALTMLGAYSYLVSSKRSWLIVACAGMFVAGISKLTGLLLCGGFLAALLVVTGMRRTIRKIDIAIVAGSLAAAAVPYIAFTLHYGSPAPNTPAQLDLLQSGAAATGWGAEPRMGAATYTIVFLKNFLAEWMPSLEPRHPFQLALLALPGATLAFAAAGTLLSWRAIGAGRGSDTDMMVAAGMLATVATLTIHIAFSYQRHLATGWMMDAYPRYYLPMMAIVPLAAMTLANAAPSARIRSVLLSFLIVAPVVLGLFGAPLG